MGTSTSSFVAPPETFRKAITMGSVHLISVHNHPSGSLDPSPDDLEVFKRLNEVGKLIGIRFLDHIIITPSSGTFSMVEWGGMDS